MRLKRKDIDIAKDHWFSGNGGHAVRTIFQKLHFKIRCLWVKEILSETVSYFSQEASFSPLHLVFEESYSSLEVNEMFREVKWAKCEDKALSEQLQNLHYHGLKLAFNSKEQVKGNIQGLYDDTADYAFGNYLHSLVQMDGTEMFLEQVWDVMLEQAIMLQRELYPRKENWQKKQKW